MKETIASLILCCLICTTAFSQEEQQAAELPAVASVAADTENVKPEKDLGVLALEFDTHYKDAGLHVGKTVQGIDDTIEQVEAARQQALSGYDTTLNILRRTKEDGAALLEGDLQKLGKDFDVYEEAALACSVACKKAHAKLLAAYELALARLENAKEQLAASEEENAALEKQVADLEAKAGNLSSRLAALQTVVAAQQTAAAAMEKALGEGLASSKQ